jgi:hypothetical protein
VDEGDRAVAALLARDANNVTLSPSMGILGKGRHRASDRLRLPPGGLRERQRAVGRVDEDPFVADAIVLHAACNLEAMRRGSA